MRKTSCFHELLREVGADCSGNSSQSCQKSFAKEYVVNPTGVLVIQPSFTKEYVVSQVGILISQKSFIKEYVVNHI